VTRQISKDDALPPTHRHPQPDPVVALPQIFRPIEHPPFTSRNTVDHSMDHVSTLPRPPGIALGGLVTTALVKA
jgi:hypothetical protein